MTTGMDGAGWRRIGTTALAAMAALGLLAAGAPRAQADEAAGAGHKGCEMAVALSQDAERKLGGALYDGPMAGAGSMAGMADTMADMKGAMPGMAEPKPETTGAMPGMAGAMPEAAGAHEVHEGQHGGVFFMAPNKVHHIEAMYSPACGVRLIVYNAFTEAIDARRFQAFVKIVPGSDAEWDREVIRFLSPAADGGFLQAAGHHDIEGPYTLELFVQFPGSDNAEMFNIPVAHKPH